MINDFEMHYYFPKHIDEIDEMDGIEFEEFLFHYFKLQGYHVQLTDDTGDRGIDINVNYTNKDGQKTRIGVQAKRWKSNVGHKEIVAMLSGKDFYNCDKLLLVTTGGLTSQAKNTALNNDIIIWTRDHIIDMLNDLKKNPKANFKKIYEEIETEKIASEQIENKNITSQETKNPQFQNTEKSEEENTLFLQLKNLRTHLAKKYNVYPVYYIYNNKTINELIEFLPLNTNELLQITGINEKKINLFGNEILNIILSYCATEYADEINQLTTIREKIKNYNDIESIEKTFDDITLIKLATKRPESLEELLDIDGFPQDNIELFGEYLVKQIRKL